jgi:membrane protein DedA with SNARE-associated domain
MVTLVRTFLMHFTYVALVMVLCAAGLGVPVPEDVPLIFSGYLCNHEYSPIQDIVVAIDDNHDGIPDRVELRRHHTPHLEIMIIAGLVGVLGGDSIVFMIGRRGIDSNNFVARHLRKVMHSDRRAKLEKHFSRHGNWTVFLGRFMPGARSIVFGMAGMSRMGYLRFICIDGVAAAISVPLFIYGGYFFADKLEILFGEINRVKHIVIPCALVIVIGGWVLHTVRKKRRLREATGALPV